MRIYGLIGYPLNHSFSPGYFRRKFEKEGIDDASYSLFPLRSVEEFTTLDGNMRGLNVTIPYKESIIPFLDELTEEAKEIGAVNTILFQNGRTTGYNTDVFGFRKSLENALEGRKPAKALVLGTGGASKAVLYVLKKMKIGVNLVSRGNGYLKYDEINKKIMDSHRLIVNTTPLGMYPDTHNCPHLPYHFLGPDHILFDLIYNPEKTLFLAQGEARSAVIKNGLEMLELQAEKSWEIWNQRD